MDLASLFSVYPPCYPNCSCEPAAPGWILQPWAFWTSLAYVASAVLIYYWHKEQNHKHLKAWVISMLFVSLGSFLAHAIFNKLSLAMDLSAIVIVMWSIHLREESGWIKTSLKTVSAWITFIIIFMMIPQPLWSPLVACFLFISAGVLGYREGRQVLLERPFLAAMAIYFFSWLLFKFDEHPLLCETPGIPYGHPTWHIGSGITTFLFGKWWFGRTARRTN